MLGRVCVGGVCVGRVGVERVCGEGGCVQYRNIYGLYSTMNITSN